MLAKVFSGLSFDAVACYRKADMFFRDDESESTDRTIIWACKYERVSVRRAQ